MSLRILVTGSREWTDEMVIREALNDALAKYSTKSLPVLIHGGARGADTIAHNTWLQWSRTYGKLAEPEVYRVSSEDWSRHGRVAGHIRNAQMVARGATVCLAFPRGASPGTRGCMDLAAKAGIPVFNFGDDGCGW